ncbi:MAG: PAS domain-containing protein [Verrucomicrobiota bacterium]
MAPAEPQLSGQPSLRAAERDGVRGTRPCWLRSQTDLGKLIAAHAWSETPLGPLDQWPAELRTSVNLMLRGGAAMALFWGKEHTALYNDRYRDIIQDKHPAALGRPGREVFPELWDRIEPLFQRACAGEAVVLDDFALKVKRNGELKESFFSGSYNPIENDAGEVGGFLAMVVETTQRVAREQERAKVFDTTLSAIADFAYSFDRNGRFLYVNKALLDLWGLKLEDAVGKNFFELPYPKELAAVLQRQIQEVIDRKTSVRDETLYISPTGVEGYYEYIFSPVFAPDGTVVVVAGSTRNITDRKKLERDLLDIQSRMDSALSAGAIGTWSWDVVKDRVWADRNLAQFFGVSEVEAQASPISRYIEAIHPDDRGDVAQKVQAVLEKGSVYTTEYRLTTPEGATRWLFARGSVLRDSAGRAIALPGTVLDVTERKKLEHRLQQTIADLENAKAQLEHQAGALEQIVRDRTARLQETVTELESFSYSISHDLRGPLRSMQSFAQALEEDCGGEVSATGKDYIRRIVRAASRMDRIIQDVLVYSRIARTDLPLERIELQEFIASLLEGYPSFHDAAADIVLERNLPAVLANPAALTQCVANLVGNALKFVAPGIRPAVRISGRLSAGRVLLTISDNGIGIPESAHETIFAVFHRLHTHYDGTGIGLAIVRKAVERMGGTITVRSDPGHGSAFTLDLAAADPS